MSAVICCGVAAMLLAACGNSSTTPSRPCADDDLTVGLGPQYGAMGHLTQRIDFTNRGGDTCTLTGYPGVSLGGGNPPAQIGLSATRTRRDPSTGDQTPRAVPLRPHAVAHALVQVTRAENVDPTTCDPVPATLLIVYPPDAQTAAQLPFHALACAGPVPLLEVTFVTAGA
jgi:hypothetical protein